MPILRPLSASEQTAARLRTELGLGHWVGFMPGVRQLTDELGVNHKTIKAALRQLEHEGLLVNQGQGRKRVIVPRNGKSARPLRVACMLFESYDQNQKYIIELQHALREAGHTSIIAAKSLTELKMDVARISRVVQQTEADAWVVMAGNREVLEWFSAQAAPAFALFGRRGGVRIAAKGPDKLPAMVAATRHLTGLGHRRIVLVARRDRRLPEPGRVERAFLDELQAHGIAPSVYHLPDWEETLEGFQVLLNSLFRVTPPTAMIIDEAQIFTATLQYLGNRSIRVPQQISLVCTDADPVFFWCRPAISHIQWDAGPVIRRIVRWAAAVSEGRRDVKQSWVPAEFIVGGTTGPVVEGKG